MKKAKLFLSLLTVSLLVLTQVQVASAAPAYKDTGVIHGTVQEITLATDPNTGVTSVLVTVLDSAKVSHKVRLSPETADDWGLVTLSNDGSGNLVINKDALGMEVELKPKDVLPESDELQHPVGSAIATYFSDIPGLEYDTVMSAHQAGNGFGLIAQVLWITRKLGGDFEDFLYILDAKKSGDFSGFTFDDGSSPLTWEQFKKAVLDEKDNLGVVMSNRDNNNGNAGNNGNAQNNGNKDKDKDKQNNGNNGNRGNQGNGNGNPNRP